MDGVQEGTGADTAGPLVEGVAFAGSAPRDTDGNRVPETYWQGDAIAVAVTFTEAVEVDTASGTPALALRVGTNVRAAAYASGTGTDTLVFAYEVARDETDADGVSVPAGAIALNGGTLADAAGNDAALAYDALAADAARRVDGRPARVTGLAFAGTAPRNADGYGAPETYWQGDAIAVAVTFGRAVTVTGAPSLALAVGSATVQASYASGSGTDTLVFAYTVRAGDAAPGGVSVPAGAIALNGGTLADAAGNDAALAHDALARDVARLVDGSTTPARVTGIAFAGAAPRDADRDGAGDTYRAGDVVEVEAAFDRTVTVRGVPTVALELGDATVQASYTGGSGTTTLAFAYTVRAGDEDTDGMSVPADPITLGSGRIGDAAGVAVLAHGGLAADAARRVDGVAPGMTGAVRNEGSLNRGDFGAGDTLRIAVLFSEPVFPGGAPTLELTMADNSKRTASYAGRDEAYAASADADPVAVLWFDYAVQSTDVTRGGVLTGPGARPLAGTVTDAAGNAVNRVFDSPDNALFTLNGAQAGADAVAPRVTGVAFAGAAPRDTDGNGVPETYGAGDAVAVAVTYSEAVEVDTGDGTPALALLVGTTERAASYDSGSGTETLVFVYTVQAGETDRDGVSVPAGAIALNGGTITRAGGHAAALAHGALAPDAARTVDGTAAPAVVTGIAFAGSAPRDADRDGAGDTYRKDDTVEIEVTFDRAVAVTGMPTLALAVGSGTVQAAYAGGTGTATLTFSYPVDGDDEDTDGVAVPADPITLGDGAIGDAAGTATLAHDGLAADAARKVDGVAPREPDVSTNAGGGTDAGRFYRGETLRITVTFSEPVSVSGTPRFPFQAGAELVPRVLRADYAGRGGERALLFDHVAREEDSGELVYWVWVDVDGGAIVDAAGNAYAAPSDLAITPVFSGIEFDGSRTGAGDTVGPAVRAVAFAGAAPRDANGDSTPETYWQGDAIEVAVTFTEAVEVDTASGTPALALRVGTNVRAAAYASGTGTDTLCVRLRGGEGRDRRRRGVGAGGRDCAERRDARRRGRQRCGAGLRRARGGTRGAGWTGGRRG